MAQRLAPLCRHVSIRDDEAGPFIFAVAKNDLRSLELREIDGEFILELWSGAAAEDERIEEESRIPDAAGAIARAAAWLRSDAE
jgi:hypothetical protein